MAKKTPMSKFRNLTKYFTADSPYEVGAPDNVIFTTKNKEEYQKKKLESNGGSEQNSIKLRDG